MLAAAACVAVAADDDTGHGTDPKLGSSVGKLLTYTGLNPDCPQSVAETSHETASKLGNSVGDLVPFFGADTLPRCPAGATCKVMQVQNCANIAAKKIKFAKYTPAEASKGTVVFLQGGGGDLFATSSSIPGDDNDGIEFKNKLVAAGYTVLDTAWEDDPNYPTHPRYPPTQGGWFENITQSAVTEGMTKVACRPATALARAYADEDLHGTSKPFCVIGNSGGAGGIAFAMTKYPSVKTVLTAAIMTGGPVFPQLDLQCNGQLQPVPPPQRYCNVAFPCRQYLNYGGCRQGAFGGSGPSDFAHGNGPTENLCSDHDPVPSGYDNILATGELDLTSEGTQVSVMLGTLDESQAPPFGKRFWDCVDLAFPGSVQLNCVEGMYHSHTRSLAGQTAVLQRIQADCQ